jgi:hypothetical protein
VEGICGVSNPGELKQTTAKMPQSVVPSKKMKDFELLITMIAWFVIGFCFSMDVDAR